MNQQESAVDQESQLNLEVMKEVEMQEPNKKSGRFQDILSLRKASCPSQPPKALTTHISHVLKFKEKPVDVVTFFAPIPELEEVEEEISHLYSLERSVEDEHQSAQQYWTNLGIHR